MTDSADSASPTASIITKYESLRGAALGAALPPDTRGGLALFLRRGMWSWSRALVTANVSRQVIRPASDSTAPHERKTVQLFAAMAMNPDKRGAS